MNDYDPTMVDLYDSDNPSGPDHDFCRALAEQIDARAIIDLGCGTGLLTVTLARPGRRVVGIDPSRSMLAYAAARAGGDAVRWILGDSRDIPDETFDYAMMTGNVAQHIPDPEWELTLAQIRGALDPGGVLAQIRGALDPGGVLVFESRNPVQRAWEAWAAEPATTRVTARGPLREWTEATQTQPGIVELTCHTVLEATGERIVEHLTLAFRSRERLEAQLHDAGFTIDGVWADWQRTAHTPQDPLMVFEARAT